MGMDHQKTLVFSINKCEKKLLILKFFPGKIISLQKMSENSHERYAFIESTLLMLLVRFQFTHLHPGFSLCRRHDSHRDRIKFGL